MSQSCTDACNEYNQCQAQILKLVQEGQLPSTEFNNMCFEANTRCDNCEGGAPTSLIDVLAAPAVSSTSSSPSHRLLYLYSALAVIILLAVLYVAVYRRK
jgi:hypothetical protein